VPLSQFWQFEPTLAVQPVQEPFVVFSPPAIPVDVEVEMVDAPQPLSLDRIMEVSDIRQDIMVRCMNLSRLTITC
jgi:hypothetical protein